MHDKSIMVLWFRNTSTYNHDFATASLAFLNRYPNPYSSHVLSVDTVSQRVDENGILHQTKLIKKTGKLPAWARPFLGEIQSSWIIEKTSVDPKSEEMFTYTRNVNHVGILRIEEFSQFKYDSEEEFTRWNTQVKFSSGMKWGVKDRIERWSQKVFISKTTHAKQGLQFVMENFQAKLKSQPS